MSESRRERLPELDGLRVIMIFIVSWYHIWQQSWLTPYIGSYSLDYLLRSGYVWVDGTVLLSSFLLFLPYAKARQEGTPLPDTRAFYYRRARRILPGFYFIILATFLCIALPWDLYRGNGPYMVKDLATHMSFTFPFFYDTYVATPLGAASWTLAIEVQAYALFPLIARGAVKKPGWVLGILAGVCFGFRAWCLWGLSDYTMVVNQLINFLDVYAIGMVAAMVHVRLSGRTPRKGSAVIWTAVFAGCVWGLLRLLRVQAASSGYPMIQRNQMVFRPAYAVLFSGMMLSSGRCLRALRWVLGNRVMRFLAGISMNYYLTHQVIIVHMRRIGFPPSESEKPNMVGEQPWQWQYVVCSFVFSFIAAVVVTYCVEKPAAKIIDRLHNKS